MVWYAAEPAYSLAHSARAGSGILDGPAHSAFKGQTVLFGVEAVHDATTAPTQTQARDQTNVAIRYVFVLPSGLTGGQLTPPPGKALRLIMEQTNKNRRSGKLIHELARMGNKMRPEAKSMQALARLKGLFEAVSAQMS